MDRPSDSEQDLEQELNRLAQSHPLYPRAWKAEVERRAAWPGWDVEDAVYALKEERGFVSPGPATLPKLVADEKRFLALFEPDELLAGEPRVPARSSAD